MKNLVSFVFLLALLVSGCSEEEMLRNGTSASGGRVFTTSFENDESRTYVENGTLLRWTYSDQITLFDGNTLPLQYQFRGGTGANSGTFYMVGKPEGTGTSLNHNYALYPYAQDVKVPKEGVLTATLPFRQHYANNSFGLGDNTMVAVTRNVDDLFLNFKNVGGYLKLQLYGDDVTVKSITLTGNNDEKIAGEATLAVGYDEAPVVSMADSAFTSITLDCGEAGVKLGTSEEEATEFWIVVPPTVFEKGFTVKVRDFENGVFVQTTDKKQVIERNVVKPMAVVKAVMEQDRTSLAISEDEEELEGWEAGMFGGNGTYVMGKPHGENGYLMTMGNVLEENATIVYMDSSRQVREIFIDNTIITFGENTNGSVDVSIIDKDGNETIEKIALSGLNVRSRASDDHGQQVGSIKLAFNLKDLYDVSKDIIEDGGFTKKTALEYLGTKIEALNNLVRAAGGPDLLGNLLGSVGPWLDRAEGLAQLRDLALMYRAGATGGLAGACIAIYAGLYTTYLDLYDEHIESYFGNNQVSIKDITYKGDGLNIELAISGCEPWYDVECGVIIKTEAFPAPRYSDGLATKTVVRNGEYIFVEGNVQTDKTYYCRPFLITKDRASLWKGFIGDIFGPLVRYGKTKEFKPEDELRKVLIELYESTNGNNWTNKKNWCSDKPVEEWYGVAKDQNGKYGLALSGNNLTGVIDQVFPECVVGLNVNENMLTSINVSGSEGLESLNCNYRNYKLTSLNISGCTNLKSLYTPSYYTLTTLDVSGCTSLTTLSCRMNKLTSLDVSSCTSLVNLDCDLNQLTSLNVSGCSALTELDCSGNQLTSLNVSGCSALTELCCNGNQFVSLDVSGCTALKQFSFSSKQLTSLDISGCTALESFWVQYIGAEQLTSLDASNCTSLKKLEIEPYLTSLDVSGCTALSWLSFSRQEDLTSLNASNCISLTSLNLADASLTSLDVSGCTALKKLQCQNNQLTTLDVSGCTSLVTLSCGGNQLTSLNVSGCTALEDLSCDRNQLTSLNLSDCMKLGALSCGNNLLSSLDVSGFSALQHLNCRYNDRLTSLNVSGTALSSIELTNGQLSSLNVAGCTSLWSLRVNNNRLTSLNVSGCTALISLNCNNNQLSSLNVSGFTALSSLQCAVNQLTSLNVSGCTEMYTLHCSNNQLTSLDVSSCKKLKLLYCDDNKIKCEIPEWFDKFEYFFHDQRYRYYLEYEYWEEYGEKKEGWVTKYEDKGYGWWYPGEPQKGYHSRY